MIVGHEKQLAVLEKFINGADTHHSFLFIGPENIGKKTIAESFAHRLINDEKEVKWRVVDGRDSDLLFVAPEIVENKNKKTVKDIPIDDIRDARNAFALSQDKSAKVLVIDDAHRMTIPAQNALLKTLEEPKGKSFIILVTHASEQLLETIYSRCFLLRFDLLQDKDLKKMYPHSQFIDQAQGRPGYLHRLHTDEAFREVVEYAHKQLQELFSKKLYQRMDLAAELAKKDDQYIAIFFTVWIDRIWRAAHKNKKYNLLKAAEKVEHLLVSLQRSNVNKQLALEDLLIHIV